ncbi:MAG: hypothetical protein ACLGHL_10925, partial [Actinomycetota bacterium]
PFFRSDPSDAGLPGEVDVVALGARSFAGAELGDGPVGEPAGVDPLEGTSWVGYVEGQDTVEEPLELVVATREREATTEARSVRFFIDAGADGVFADEELQADYLYEKVLEQSGWCAVDLTAPELGCIYRHHGSSAPYLSAITSVVLDASEIDVFEPSAFAVRAEVCGDHYSGDVPQPICDESQSLVVDLAAPAAIIEPQHCGGLWSTFDCAQPISVTIPGPAAEILAILPEEPTASHPILLRP